MEPLVVNVATSVDVLRVLRVIQRLVVVLKNVHLVERVIGARNTVTSSAMVKTVKASAPVVLTVVGVTRELESVNVIQATTESNVIKNVQKENMDFIVVNDVHAAMANVLMIQVIKMTVCFSTDELFKESVIVNQVIKEFIAN